VNEPADRPSNEPAGPELPASDLQGDLPSAAASMDPQQGLVAVRALRVLADRLEDIHVRNARAQGWSWQAIADALLVSRQAVHQKHSRD
jgi:hypothetical protein